MPESETVQPKASVPAPMVSLEETIRRRAFEIYEARNGAPGNEVYDWLLAEQELRRSVQMATRKTRKL